MTAALVLFIAGCRFGPPELLQLEQGTDETGSLPDTGGGSSTGREQDSASSNTGTGSGNGDGNEDPDNDGDTYPASEDCDDSDPSIHPGADERCNGIDDDCDPTTTEDGIISVDGNGDGNLDGTWKSISQAVEGATEGAEVRICPGYYEDNIWLDRSISLVAQQDASVTVIASASPSAPVIRSTEGRMVGLTLTGASGMFVFALSAEGGATIVEDCVVTGNSAGVIVQDGAQLEGSSTTISDNELGLYVASESSATLTSASIVDNIGPQGAAAFVEDDATLLLENCLVWRNAAMGDGSVYLSGPGSSLSSDNCHWGTGLAENSPNDIWAATSSQSWNYGKAATFDCNPGCSP